VVPPNPVTLQKRSYSGTEAKDSPNINKNIDTSATGVKFFLLMFIIFLDYISQYYRKLIQTTKS